MKTTIISAKIVGIILLIFLISVRCISQEADTAAFRITAKPILRVFANYHMQIGPGDVISAFEVERAYLGYDAQIHPNFQVKINLDIGSPDDVSEYSRIRRYAYFKNAALKYTYKWLTSSFGLIDMTHFKLQEEFWGHRYIEKSFADRFRFGHSADLGWNLIVEPVKNFSIDLSFTNGEGYNNLQRDNTLKLGLGVSATVFENWSVRIYGDLMEKGEIESTLAAFIGYRYRDLFRIGTDYNHKFNDSYRPGYDRYGYSVYSNCSIIEPVEVFARYDWVNSNMPADDDTPWNLNEDGSSITAGVQYQPIQQVKIALSYRDWYPYASNLDNEALIYLNLEYKY